MPQSTANANALGIAFDGGSLDKQVIGFSDNLTTLIGGRGTGKSALIEAIRFVLGQPISGLPDQLQHQERLDFTIRDTDIKLLFAGEQEERFLFSSVGWERLELVASHWMA